MIMRNLCSLLLVAVFAVTATGQVGLSPEPQRRRDRFPPPGADQCAPNDHLCEEQKYKREKQANAKRQADLKRDTDRLYQLASELKESVDKSTENTLAVDVVKKADEIEKLAKSVKNKMKGD
jgi:hypothetical protein